MTPVGVVVLTHDRREEAVRTLEHVLALPERPPLVVVDNASSDGTAERLARRFPEVEVIRLAENFGAAGRNVGVRRLATPYVAFCDDDTWWAPGALARAADILDRYPRLALITGRVLVGPGQREDPTCREMAESPLLPEADLPGPPVLGFLAAATVIRRAAFLAAGGFEPRLWLGAEERLLAIDLAAEGWGLAYVPDIAVHHHPSVRRDGQVRRRILVRNELWCAWLRRPLPGALGQTMRTLRALPDEPARARALLAALAGLPWVLSHRRVVPERVEDGLRRLESTTLDRHRPR